MTTRVRQKTAAAAYIYKKILRCHCGNYPGHLTHFWKFSVISSVQLCKSAKQLTVLQKFHKHTIEKSIFRVETTTASHLLIIKTSMSGLFLAFESSLKYSPRTFFTSSWHCWRNESLKEKNVKTFKPHRKRGSDTYLWSRSAWIWEFNAKPLNFKNTFFKYETIVFFRLQLFEHVESFSWPKHN